MTPAARAAALEVAGRDAEAVTAWMDAFTASPGEPGIAQRLALAMARVGHADKATEVLALAVSLHPKSAALHMTRGNLLKGLGRFEEALAEQDLALRLAPGDAEVQGNRCALFLAWKRFDEALAAADAALQAAPGVTDHLFNRGTCLLHLGRCGEAVADLRQAVERSPGHVKAHLNLGEALLGTGAADEAEREFRLATELAPRDAEAHWNLALRLLARGEWARGWREYEWRRTLPGFSTRSVSAPDWNGAPLDGTLLVTAEQGLGDTFQFSRYLAVARSRVRRLVFEAPAALKAVLQGVRGADEVLARGEPLPEIAAHLPLLSLPACCGVVDPAQTGPQALTVAESAVASMRSKLPRGFSVGVCWQGNPAYRADARRSVPLRHFEGLARLERVSLVSLQKRGGREQLAHWPKELPLLDLGATLDESTGAFVETAAALAALDLVISSDTALPHLAGALGREVWVLLAHDADWRWGSATETTAWYPGWRVFRQTRPGDWGEVFERVAQALAQRV